MRKTLIIPALSFMALLACNSSGSGEKTSADSSAMTAAPAADTMHHEATATITPLPAIPAGAKVFFKNIKDGATVSSPLKIEMGVSGIQLDSAGAIKAGSGHHHLLVDAGDSIPEGIIVPKDSTHYHFGNAQTEADIKLTPGKHRLTLQYADGIHRSYGSKLASSVTVNVKK